MAGAQNNRENLIASLICLTLAIGTLACYWPALHFDYVRLDDSLYVYEAPMVQHGLSWPGVVWAFRTVQGGNWNPLVWLSQMTDTQFLGPQAGGHHLTNILLHTLNVILLFLVFRKMTRATWRSAFVAAIFAWHPLHVESVAWISERKDVLSTLFWLLTMWAYAHYASKAQSPGATRTRSYGLALLCFAFGLISKPMLVTLPAVLLLLDYWPLQRTESFRKLLLEKLPFFLFSLVISAVTIWAQKKSDAVGNQGLLLHVQNALTSYVTYIIQFFRPANLAIFYPYPHSIAPWRVGGAIAILLAVTLAVWKLRSRKFLVTGWFWYLLTLLPVIGFFQVGMQAMADRYTYIPYVGLSLMLSWGLGEIAERRPWTRIGIGFASTAALGGCLAVTSHQLQYWRNNMSLFQHALEVTSDNYLAHSNLGHLQMDNGNLDDAVKQFQEVVRLLPNSPKPYNDLGKAYALQNKMDAAYEMFSKALYLDPNLPEALWNHGNALLQRGRTSEGFAEMEKSARIRPNDIAAQSKFADALFQAGKGAEALPYCEAVVRAQPWEPHAHFMLGAVYLAQKRPKEAVASFTESVRLAPDNPHCLNALAWIYASSSQKELRNGPEAVRLAERACEISKRQNTAHLDTLAAAYAESGRFEDAIKTANEMLALAESTHNDAAAKIATDRIALYRTGKSFAEPQ